MKKTKGNDVPVESFPDTLEGFGYEFNNGKFESFFVWCTFSF